MLKVFLVIYAVVAGADGKPAQVPITDAEMPSVSECFAAASAETARFSAWAEAHPEKPIEFSAGCVLVQGGKPA